MTTISEAIVACLKANSSKQTMSFTAIRTAVNQSMGSSHSQGAITDELKKQGYEIVKSSINNPYY